ncbi:MAG TPA: 2-dehydropantoate 2-reductase [Burkholderiales bacterium]|nr:2-dehydropantoate 2-reductase [Burkholderiales bacterium]
MKILIMGSGGVGGFYGGRLAHAGCDVTFVARGTHLAAMRAHGLLIENEAQGNILIKPVTVTDDPTSAGTPDLIIFAVKLWDTEAVAKSLKSIVGPNTAVLSLQNGVVKDDILSGVFGEKVLMGGVAYVGTHIARPGVIHQVGTLQRLAFGEYDGKKSARAQALLAALLKAGIQAELSGDIRRTLWEKYTFLVGLSGATATMRTAIGPVRENPQTRAFLHDLMKETVAVGRALGVALPENYADDRLKFADSVPATMDASLHHDLKNGNRLEVEWLAGGVVQLGQKAGVPTPCNRAVWDVLALHAGGRQRSA